MTEEKMRVASMDGDLDQVSSGPPEDVVESNGSQEPPKPDEKLWDPDGPTMAQIEEWKAQHGDLYVTSVTPERHYVWRTLKRSEYRMLVQRMEQQIADGVSQAMANMDNEEAITELCVLVPKYARNDNSHMAGVASIVTQECMEASGFIAVDVRSL